MSCNNSRWKAANQSKDKRDKKKKRENYAVTPLHAKLNPVCYLLALLVAHHIFHVSGVRVKFT
jgi:hypothetical protein